MKKINLPTKITIIRIIISILLIIAIAVVYFLDEAKVFSVTQFDFSLGGVTLNSLMITFWLTFLIASLTDFLDGYLARKNNQVTDLGKFLDPIADKMLINSIMIFLCFNFVSLNNELTFPWICVVLMVIRDLVVDGLRFMAATKNVVLAANYWGKAKTVLQMVAISLVMLNGFPFSYFDANWLPYLHITDFICYLATIVSLIGGFVYLRDNKNVFDEKK
ncbi:MAG: CDP-diacylglycerol--glycerol-3-phosphate 3-phosphatidyltransferase [Bacilli bacterium]|jgi:CDP-diacylglycerol--glycerol-3-phosphate 3-phosphatidyltransferase